MTLTERAFEAFKFAGLALMTTIILCVAALFAYATVKEIIINLKRK